MPSICPLYSGDRGMASRKMRAVYSDRNLVTQFIGEFDDLVLDRRTIPRPNALDLSAIQRRPWNGLTQNARRLFRGIPNVALDLRPCDLVGEKRKRRRLGVARLRFESRPVRS